MNLLLLLSALLSAITGVSVTGRAPQAVTEVASVAARVAATTEEQAITRPVATLPSLRSVAVAAPFVGTVIAPIEPIYAARRRE